MFLKDVAFTSPPMKKNDSDSFDMNFNENEDKTANL